MLKHMRYVKLGSSNIDVSEVCLGSMTWGEQNTEREAHQQLDYALNQGINFIDTAEMYSVPPKAETFGLTETYIGNWIKRNKKQREQLVLATKVTGPGVSWARDGAKISGKLIEQAVDESLRRLQTDYIDLYQLHWPNRAGPHFAKHWPGMIDYHAVDIESTRAEFLDILTALQRCINAGKIRHCGLSNDTPWGLKEYLQLAEQNDLPRMASVQNEFNLLHLMDSPHLIEACLLDEVAYLPWSPIAGGALTGKYRNGARPVNCRWTLIQRLGIFRDTIQAHQAIEAYYQIAQKYGFSLTELCLAWIYQFEGVTSTIIGATSMAQLKEDIGAYSIILTEEIKADIDAVIRQYPVPF